MKKLTLKDLDDGVIIVMPSGFKYKVHRVQCQLTHGGFSPWSRELEIGLKGYSYFEPTAQPKSEEENIMKKEFTKKDLKSGYRVQYRKGDFRTVFLNSEYGDILSGNDNWATLSGFGDDLLSEMSEFDIMAVYAPDACLLTRASSTEFGFLVWKREEKPSEQIAYEALQAQIAEEEARHADSMKALREKAEKLKQKNTP